MYSFVARPITEGYKPYYAVLAFPLRSLIANSGADHVPCNKAEFAVRPQPRSATAQEQDQSDGEVIHCGQEESLTISIYLPRKVARVPTPMSAVHNQRDGKREIRLYIRTNV